MTTFVNRRNSKLLPCPLCGNDASITQPVEGVYNISCGTTDECCDTCGLVLFGGSEDKQKDMIERWNQRQNVPDELGKP